MQKYRNTNPGNCIIGHLNINSIRNKFDAVECILSEGFSVCDIFDDEDDRLWGFSKLLSGVIDSNAPVKTKILKKPSVPYMNSRLRQAIHRKNMLRNAYKKRKVKWDDYRKQRNLTTAINKQSKLTYFRERCDGGPKNQSFLKTIKPFMSDKSLSHGKQVILQEGDKIISDTNEICEIFNTYFTSVANNIGFDDSIPPDFYTEDGFSAMINKHSLHPSIVKIKENISSDFMFNFQCINGLDIAEIIRCFDGKKAQGYDMIPMKLLQKCAPYIAPEISKLVNNFIIKSVFPNDLKFAEVSSLFKKKDALSKINYRPVNILIALSKIYEKAVSVQLADYFSHIFSSLLSAFRKGYSCQSTLLNMIENFKCALDRGEYIACISMDISKAFDCLPHCLTICKLHAYGLSRNACTLIASYLYQRKQRVKIGNIRSIWKETDKGVPQGSILGPLIFNIFMNDLFYFVKYANLFNYANDNSVSVSGKELSLVSRLLQSEAEVTVRWFCENAMEANPSKSQGILFKGNKQADDFKLSVNEHDIEFSKSMTSLGICIIDTLTFDSHINDICLKASRQISALQRLTGLLDYPSRRAIYNSFISSHFNYCPLVWFFTSRASIVKMQTIQVRALRFVLKDSVSDYKFLLSKSGVDSFRISSMKNMAVEIYKILNNMGRGYLSSLFEKSNVPYQLRDNNKLVQPLKRTTTCGIKSFAYFGAHLWNLLPHHIKESVSLYNFKTLIKKWSGPTCSCCVCSLVVWCFAFIYFNPFILSYHILSTKYYCVCTLLLYTSHWKCPFRTEYLFQETLYIHNVRNDLFTLVLINFDLSYLILLYLLYTNIYGPHWIFCNFFIHIYINLNVQNVYSERFLSVWFYLVYHSKFYFIMLHECCIYCIYVYIYIYTTLVGD